MPSTGKSHTTDFNFDTNARHRVDFHITKPTRFFRPTQFYRKTYEELNTLKCVEHERLQQIRKKIFDEPALKAG